MPFPSRRPDQESKSKLKKQLSQGQTFSLRQFSVCLWRCENKKITMSSRRFRKVTMLTQSLHHSVPKALIRTDLSIGASSSWQTETYHIYHIIYVPHINNFAETTFLRNSTHRKLVSGHWNPESLAKLSTCYAASACYAACLISLGIGLGFLLGWLHVSCGASGDGNSDYMQLGTVLAYLGTKNVALLCFCDHDRHGHKKCGAAVVSR